MYVYSNGLAHGVNVQEQFHQFSLSSIPILQHIDARARSLGPDTCKLCVLISPADAMTSGPWAKIAELHDPELQHLEESLQSTILRGRADSAVTKYSTGMHFSVEKPGNRLARKLLYSQSVQYISLSIYSTLLRKCVHGLQCKRQ